MTSLKLVYSIEELILILACCRITVSLLCCIFFFISKETTASKGEKLCSWPKILIGFGLAKM